jgi:transposase
MEIILGQARRRWSLDQKRALVAETLEPGGTVNSVARRHGINPSMLFSWRRRFRDELTSGGETAGIGFAEVALAPPSSERPAPALTCSGAGIAIEFGSGVRMTLTGAVDPRLAVAMAKALSGR